MLERLTYSQARSAFRKGETILVHLVHDSFTRLQPTKWGIHTHGFHFASLQLKRELKFKKLKYYRKRNYELISTK